MPRDPMLDENGDIRTVTRLEFEPLLAGQFRWSMWAGDVRVHSEVAGPGNLPAILATTAMFCGADPRNPFPAEGGLAKSGRWRK